MAEYKSADQIPLDKAIEAIVGGALRAMDAHDEGDEVGGFMFEVIAGGRIGPRGNPTDRPGTAIPGSAKESPGGAGSQGTGGYGTR